MGFELIGSATECTACLMNYYKSFVGNGACVPCPDGESTGVLTGATRVEQCSECPTIVY